ncbi:MAG TPA: hypothetical protein VK528_14275 [Flavobacterium sp.]|nr:hypothetical protein [Flavobacterium sp.]
MKIDITIPQALQSGLPDTTSLYNIIKRNEEDLLRRIPNLKEFLLDLSGLPEHAITNSNNILARHQLSGDESALRMIIRYHRRSSVENISKSIVSELAKIKAIYY